VQNTLVNRKEREGVTPLEHEPELARTMERAFSGCAKQQEGGQDVYVEHLMECLPAELVRSLTPDQYRALKKAFTRYQTRHMLDVRGTIPLIFTQYYFVLLFGKDRRQSTQSVLADRRRDASEKGSQFVSTLVTALLYLMVVAGLFMLFYFVKSIDNFNIFPGFHLRDLWK
jgi:hypothetical protein